VLVAVSTVLLPGASAAYAAPGEITTVAGGPGYGPALNVGQSATSLAASGTRLWVADSAGASTFLVRAIDTATGQEAPPLLERGYAPSTSVALGADAVGNLFMAYTTASGGLVEKLSPTGATHIVAGGGTQAPSDGAQATSEHLPPPSAIAADARGNVYVAENDNSSGPAVPGVASTGIWHAIVWKIRPDGTMSRFAGTDPSAIAVAPTVLGTGANSVVVNTGLTPPLDENVPARAVSLSDAKGLATDTAGNVYITEQNRTRIRRVGPDGFISTFAGGGSSEADGVPATQAALAFPSDIAADRDGLLINDPGSHKIRRVSAGTIKTVVGSGAYGSSGDGGPATAAAATAVSLATTGGRIFLGEFHCCGDPLGPGVIRTVDAAGIITRFAGGGDGDGGPALQAQFYAGDLATDSAGNTYIAEVSRVRRIDPSGTITTFAGTGVPEPLCCDTAPIGDGGPATEAEFRYITDVAVGPDSSVYIVDRFANAIRRVDSSGIIRTVAGTGAADVSPDGSSAATSPIFEPRGIAFDPAGDLLFGENCKVRRIDQAGVLSTFAGSQGASAGVCPANSGDGGPASAATFAGVGDLTADRAGNVYVAVPYGSVRKVDTAGTITTVAGGGSSDAEGVPATSALIEAYAIGLDRQDNLLIVSRFNEPRVRRVDPDGTIHTIAGGGTGGDGVPATSSQLKGAAAVAFDPAGDLLILSEDIRYQHTFGVIREVSAA